MKKLNSQKGASILLALMLFLVCFMVSSAIVTSATANADKIRNRDAYQKGYLSVGSAANFLQDVFGGLEYTAWEKNTVYECQAEYLTINPARHNDLAEISTQMTYDEGYAARIKEDLADMIYEAFQSHTQYLDPIVVEDVLTREFVISGDGMEDILLKMSLDTDSYLLTCVLTLNDVTEEDNAMTVMFKASVSAPSKDAAEKVVMSDMDTHQVYVEGELGWAWVTKTYDITEYTLNTKVMYDTGFVTKGVYP